MVQGWEGTVYFEGKGKKKSNTAMNLYNSNIVKTAEY